MIKRLYIDLREDGTFALSSPDDKRTTYCRSIRELYKNLPFEISNLQSKQLKTYQSNIAIIQQKRKGQI